MKPVPDTSLEILCTAFEGLADGLASNIVDLFCNGQHMEAADMAETLSDIVAAAAKARTRTLSRRAAAAAGYASPTPTPPKESVEKPPAQDDLFPDQDPADPAAVATSDMWAGFKPEVEQRPGLDIQTANHLCGMRVDAQAHASTTGVVGTSPAADAPAVAQIPPSFTGIPDDELDQIFRVFGRPADHKAPGTPLQAAFESVGTVPVDVTELTSLMPPVMPKAVSDNLPPIRSIADGPAQPLAKPGT